MKESLKLFNKKIIDSVLKPFSTELNFFISTLLVSGIVDFIFSCIYDKFTIAAYLVLHHIVICYLLTWICGIIPTKIRSSYKILIFFLLLVNSIIDLSCAFIFHQRFCLDYADIIMESNVKETVEFANTYVTPVLLILLAVLLFSQLWCIKKISKLKIQIKRNIQVTLLSIVVCGCIYIFCSGRNMHWGIVSLGKIQTFLLIPNVNLSDYKVHPNLSLKSEHSPKNVVLIIGESFAKLNSSLYGYDKETNPCLDSLRNLNRISVFNDVKTSGLHTIEAFKTFMSTYTFDSNKEWYECLTIPEVMNTLDYHTEWISNQSKKGFYDNVITKYALLCDTMMFTGNQYAGQAKADKDELLIDMTKERMKENADKKRCFYVIHMIGSHNEFRLRYTDKYKKFKPEDYPHNIESQRTLLSQYDNSILYNDYVVSELMKLFENEESIVFYFSDHGLDVYNTKDDYIGHAIKGNPKSCSAAEKIPFLIYMSEIYQKKFPEKYNSIINSINKKYSTEDFIYSLMDILDVNFSDNDDVQQKSIFR